MKLGLIWERTLVKGSSRWFRQETTNESTRHSLKTVPTPLNSKDGASKTSSKVNSINGSSGSEIKSSFPWLEGSVAKSFWGIESNVRRYTDWLGQKLGYDKPEHWYKVTKADFITNRGSGLLGYHKSIGTALNFAYPDYKFESWMFSKALNGAFNERETRIKVVDWVISQAGVKSKHELTTEHFLKFTPGLLAKFGRSPHRILESLEPEKVVSDSSIPSTSDPNILLARNKPKNYWASLDNQREYLDMVGKKLGVKGDDLSPWYATSFRQLVSYGLGGLLGNKVFNRSIFRLLKTVYPHYSWEPWKFDSLPKKVANDPTVAKAAITAVEKRFSISSPEGWYYISRNQMKELGVLYVVSKNGGLFDMLLKFKPDVKWEKDRFISP